MFLNCNKAVLQIIAPSPPAEPFLPDPRVLPPNGYPAYSTAAPAYHPTTCGKLTSVPTAPPALITPVVIQLSHEQAHLIANVLSSPHLQETWQLNKDAAPTLPLTPGLRHWVGCCPYLVPRRSPPGSPGLGGVLASPASGQKSSLGLTAQQTAAEAEQNLNVALLGREAKNEDKEERLSVASGFLQGWRRVNWLAEES